MTVSFSVETFHPSSIPVWMMNDHFTEVGTLKHLLKLEPNWDRYMEAQRKGELLFVTARDESKRLAGYMIMFLQPHLHYKSTKVAIDDVHYLMPALRWQGLGKAMIMFAEKAAAEAGATMFSMRCKADKSHGYIFESLGHTLMDYVFVKELKNAE